MRILGIDPGYAIVGYGIVDYDARGNAKPVDYGVIVTKPSDTFVKRLDFISKSINEIIDKFTPEVVSVEELFYHKNAKTVIQVAQARGVILQTTAAKIGYQNIFEYTPLQIKQALTGYGRADKHQMQHMVKLLLKLDEIPSYDDAADGLAIALCHGQSYKLSM